MPETNENQEPRPPIHGADKIAAYCGYESPAQVFYRVRIGLFGDAVTRLGRDLIGHPDRLDRLMGR
jgi:hypothetical protein